MFSLDAPSFSVSNRANYHIGTQDNESLTCSDLSWSLEWIMEPRPQLLLCYHWLPVVRPCGFVLCPAALSMLHTALLSVLRIFFDNFHSEFRVQERAGNLETRDVDENAEIFQFDIPAVYQLQPTWISRYEHVNAHSNTHTHSLSLGWTKISTISLATTASPFPVSCSTERRRSVTLPLPRTSAPACLSETRSGATGSKRHFPRGTFS